MFSSFLAVCFFLAAVAASAQQLGESQQAIVARNGAPIEENHAKGTAVYRRGPWKIDVTYGDGVAKQVTVTKLDPLSEDEIQSVLALNADGATWRELQISGDTRIWQRSDLTTARCDRIKPRSISLINSPFSHIAPATRLRQTSAGRVSSPVSPSVGAFALPKTPPHPRSDPGRPNSTSPLLESLIGKFLTTALAVCLFVGLPMLALAGLFKILLPLIRRRGARGTGQPAMDVRSSSRTGPRSDPPGQQRVSESPSTGAAVLTLENIGWENFELLAGELFRRQGYEVEITSGLGPDGGKDLTLRKGGETVLVQCKCFAADNKVPVTAMREFYGLIMAEGAQRGIFMTTGLYSRDAIEFADGKPIELLGRSEIESLMASLGRPAENLCDVRSWIDDFASGVRVTDPTCPRCRHPMRLKRGVMGWPFWGCSSFPRCKATREARMELVQALSYQSSWAQSCERPCSNKVSSW